MKPIPVLLGPTASGKTALALEVARNFEVEIVSADAMLVYRGLDIGTAKPTLAELQAVPHHLIDIVEPEEDYDVAQFVQDAERAILQITAVGKVPLIVGGTGFYVKALKQGLPLTPRADEEVQQQIWAELEEKGLDHLLGEISAVNPQEAGRMQRNPRRVVRALEVFRRTGQFPGEFGYSTPKFEYRLFGLSPDLPVLEQRIARRVERMFEEGLLDEVRQLLVRWSDHPSRRPTALQAIGYKEVLEGMEKGEDQNTMIQKITLATRQYAKRQLTWLKTQLQVECQDAAQMKPELLAYLQDF
ncbi:tRNA (adenosine(37)-N6)-dimethylallyltransferase MiaA [Deinococcus cellulosilyticus]|uniref:tRNA dimethylallyltransferase n=1 Tax=Deinococcus cellulosilyticus (strain DSM 18568 / NBRC 106333 / KACC 11606 / 5516J-15) TaxID=1223518 RepID=A0A511N5X2_DEIC1|nr:tRNA (adenosine(37)-N6)-dimethylallyltransferase MiaA [Deinococcus cellulosilyticus]GEM48260.1 tRNA dimethylallyltransferase [Deinococcus cellulosilyticus NBRC 106333 = KACC 11606]